MGWKGTVRSVSAAMRAAEREAERRRKAEFKAQQIEEAGQAVDDWKQYLDDIISVHTDKADDINWQSIANAPPLVEPKPEKRHQAEALANIENFQPRIFDFVFGGTSRRRERLDAALADAIAADSDEFARKRSEYLIAEQEREEDAHLATRVLDGEKSAYSEVISVLYDGEELYLGQSIQFKIDDNSVHAMPLVSEADDIVPTFRLKQLQSGKLSKTKMPKGEFNELYQDYVCSVALRLAGDIFGNLPLDECHVTCSATMLNTKTGHLEDAPILSVLFVRDTFERLNLSGLDPSDSLANFNHEMNFRKTKGFERIEPLKPTD
ncbi:hypothetical protein QWY75_01365 [Pontixanthobacter aestiaquae]|uniref:Uncharacterized protein n=1 Tax=Pontixanthobacter aestiaquae TaxID=1509367 RepID=A0A844Z8K8_9SPHN|nr:hypothetical protein [Pontixanthobacter aestiaquae]MDN3644849.1 hypothetical protein [Pontixanthobacter aestiaquae]MXO84148.1 hypothetical protein [Pontixanthobacter aestiaquae]